MTALEFSAYVMQVGGYGYLLAVILGVGLPMGFTGLMELKNGPSHSSIEGAMTSAMFLVISCVIGAVFLWNVWSGMLDSSFKISDPAGYAAQVIPDEDVDLLPFCEKAYITQLPGVTAKPVTKAMLDEAATVCRKQES